MIRHRCTATGVRGAQGFAPAWRWVIAIIVGVFMLTTANAATDRALAAYQTAQEQTEPRSRAAAFERAALLFAQAAKVQGGNPELHANAGTAALQAERTGLAVLELRRALASNPRHARALTNLRHARNR